jgi:hypothetical protein
VQTLSSTAVGVTSSRDRRSHCICTPFGAPGVNTTQGKTAAAKGISTPHKHRHLLSPTALNQPADSSSCCASIGSKPLMVPAELKRRVFAWGLLQLFVLGFASLAKLRSLSVACAEVLAIALCSRLAPRVHANLIRRRPGGGCVLHVSSCARPKAFVRLFQA